MLYNITMQDALDRETQTVSVMVNVPDREVFETIAGSYAHGFDVLTVRVSMVKDASWEALRGA